MVWVAPLIVMVVIVSILITLLLMIALVQKQQLSLLLSQILPEKGTVQCVLG